MDGVAKQTAKQAVRRVIGEPYVGKRLKLHNVGRALEAAALNPKTILDAGAEDATFVYWLADRYPRASVTATDMDASAIAACQAARPSRYSKRVAFIPGLFANLPSGEFDLITAFDVLEHIRDDRGAIADLFRATRPGGTIAVHVPRDQWTHADGRVERVADEDAWRINSGHVRMGYSPNSLVDLITGAGYRVIASDVWLRRWGVRAHRFYELVSHPAPLRLLSLPMTDLSSRLDHRRPAAEGNTVWLLATKPQ